MKPTSKFEWALLSVITSSAGVLLLLQLRHGGWTVDKWVIALFAIGALPWFFPLLESVDIPGGGGVRLRKLEREQERLTFLVANFLNTKQKEVLRKFADSAPFAVVNGADDYQETMKAVGDVGRAELIEQADGKPFTDQVVPFEIEGAGDLHDAYRLTRSGKQ